MSCRHCFLCFRRTIEIFSVFIFWGVKFCWAINIDASVGSRFDPYGLSDSIAFFASDRVLQESRIQAFSQFKVMLSDKSEQLEWRILPEVEFARDFSQEAPFFSSVQSQQVIDPFERMEQSEISLRLSSSVLKRVTNTLDLKLQLYFGHRTERWVTSYDDKMLLDFWYEDVFQTQFFLLKPTVVYHWASCCHARIHLESFKKYNDFDHSRSYSTDGLWSSRRPTIGVALDVRTEHWEALRIMTGGEQKQVKFNAYTADYLLRKAWARLGFHVASSLQLSLRLDYNFVQFDHPELKQRLYEADILSEQQGNTSLMTIDRKKHRYIMFSGDITIFFFKHMTLGFSYEGLVFENANLIEKKYRPMFFQLSLGFHGDRQYLRSGNEFPGVW